MAASRDVRLLSASGSLFAAAEMTLRHETQPPAAEPVRRCSFALNFSFFSHLKMANFPASESVPPLFYLPLNAFDSVCLKKPGLFSEPPTLEAFTWASSQVLQQIDFDTAAPQSWRREGGWRSGAALTSMWTDAPKSLNTVGP